MLHPEVHYGSADDGAAIAYATVGSGPVSLVLVSPMVSQLEVALEEPAYEQFISRLASWAQVVMFDRRGTGLSDRDHASADDLTLDRLSSDLRTVLSVKPVSRGIDRIAVTFDDPNLVANAGLLLVATVVRQARPRGSVQRDHPA